MLLRKIPFVNKRNSNIVVVCLWLQPQVVSGYGQKFKMAELRNNSCSSEDDEYSDPLEVAASAGARLSTPEKVSVSRKRKVKTNPAEKERNVRGSVDPNVSA